MFFRKKKYSKICMICTVYSLFEYLLYSSVEDIKKTFFVFESWMWPDFGDKFENSYCMVERGFRKKWEYVAWLYWYLIKWFKLPNYKDADLFTLDHLPHYPVLIGKHKYTLLEDGPFCHSVMMKNNLPYSTFEEQEYLLNLSIVEKGLFKIKYTIVECNIYRLLFSHIMKTNGGVTV